MSISCSDYPARQSSSGDRLWRKPSLFSLIMSRPIASRTRRTPSSFCDTRVANFGRTQTLTLSFSNLPWRSCKTRATNITKSRTMRVPRFRQFTTVHIGSAKIIWASAQARFRRSVCGAGRMSAIIAATSIVFSLVNQQLDPAKI